MTLVYINGKPIIKGYYNKNEEDFISNYFSYFGEEIISIKPPELKNIIIEKMKDKLNHINNLK